MPAEGMTEKGRQPKEGQSMQLHIKQSVTRQISGGYIQPICHWQDRNVQRWTIYSEIAWCAGSWPQQEDIQAAV